MTNDLPNFLIVGTAKAATTTIHEYLKQHPEIFMTDWKEPSFFKFKDQKNIRFTTGRPVKFVTNLDFYKSLFKDGKKKEIRGESSTPYLYFYKESISNIKNVIPNAINEVKILIVLRNPIDRAYSQYMMKVRDLVEDLTFLEAIKCETRRINENAHFDFFYTDRGLYYKQVKAYLDEFKNVKIVLYNDFKEDYIKVLNSIIKFLGLAEFNFRAIHNQNISGAPKIKFISRIFKEDYFIKRLILNLMPYRIKEYITNKIFNKNLKKVEIDNESKKYLRNFYREEINKLEYLIERDLSHWLKE